MKARLGGVLGVVLMSLALNAPSVRAQFNPFEKFYDNIARASNENNVSRLRQLLEDNGNPNELDERGRAGLHYAAINGNLQVAAILIKANAKVDLKDSLGNTPLHYAADHQHLDIAKLLIECRATVDAENKDGMTPLMLAASRGDVEIVQTLLASGANPGKTDFTGRDALSWATVGHRSAVVQAIKRAANKRS